MNYLKANFLLTQKPLFFCIESDGVQNKLSDKLMDYSIKYNMNFDEKVKIVLDLDSQDSQPSFESNKLTIPYQNNIMDDSDISQLKTIDQIYNNIHKLVNQYELNNRPCLLFILGLECLYLRFTTVQLKELFLNVYEKMGFIKQVIFQDKQNYSSAELRQMLHKVVSAKLQLLDKQRNDVYNNCYCQLITCKKTGLSSLEKYKLSMESKGPLFQKWEEEQPKQQVSEEELSRMFKSTFNLSLTTHQKNIKNSIVLPFMQAQQQEQIDLELQQKQNLIEMDEEDIDPEEDDEDDCDV